MFLNVKYCYCDHNYFSFMILSYLKFSFRCLKWYRTIGLIVPQLTPGYPHNMTSSPIWLTPPELDLCHLINTWPCDSSVQCSQWCWSRETTAVVASLETAGAGLRQSGIRAECHMPSHMSTVVTHSRRGQLNQLSATAEDILARLDTQYCSISEKQPVHTGDVIIY